MFYRQQLKRLENCAYRGDSPLAMKSHLLLTTIAAVVLVGCGESQQSALPPEVEPAEPVAVATQPEPPTAKASNLNVVPTDEIDWGWSITPTFPNEAYGPRTDVDPELIGDNHLSMGKLYPENQGHSPLAAVTLLEKNVAAGNSGMWLGSTDGTVEQVWLNGKWVKNVSDEIDTGESYPDMAGWIYSIIDQ